MLEEQRAAGATAGELAAFQAQMAQMQDLYANPLFRVLITLTEVLPIGLLVALVAALLLRNPRFMPAQPAESVTKGRAASRLTPFTQPRTGNPDIVRAARS